MLNLVIPAAGVGSRLRPHTLHRPKPLMHVGGDVMLAHVLRSLSGADIDTTCLVVGHLGTQLTSYAQTLPGRRVKIVWQNEPLGQAHAIVQARQWLDGPVLVAFPDTILDVDLSVLQSAGTDGALFAHDVDEPARFGVVVTDERGRALQLVEKPTVHVSRRAVVGLYYVARGEALAMAIDTIIRRGRSPDGEVYLVDALQQMIDDGAVFAVHDVRAWADCGVPGDLLDANHQLLSRLEHNVAADTVAANEIRGPVAIAADATVSGSVVGPRVFIGPGCRVEGSHIGPDVSLAANATIVNAGLRDTIAEAGAGVWNSQLAGSLLGASCRVRGARGSMSLGDGSSIGSSVGSSIGSSVGSSI